MGLMGNLVWTAITYAATIGIVIIIFRMVVQDRLEASQDANKMEWLNNRKDTGSPEPVKQKPRFGAPKKRFF